MSPQHQLVALRWQSAGIQEAIEVQPFQQWPTEDGAVWASFHRLPRSYLIRFPGLADFYVSADGREVAGFRAAGVSDETAMHLYLNQVLPLALSRQLRLVLHGSAVEIDECAVAFLGRSGLGKSTLAASFAASGARFLTDDGLLLEESGTGGYLVQPSHPSIRLWDDSRTAVLPPSASSAPAISYTPKMRMLAGASLPFCSDPRPLSKLYILASSDSEEISITRIGGRDAVIEMIRNCFLLDVDQQAMLQHQHAQLLSLAGQIESYRLAYPRRFERLADVRQAITTHVSQAPGRAGLRVRPDRY